MTDPSRYTNRWIVGATRTGKTTCLVSQFVDWVTTGFDAVRSPTNLPQPMLSQRSRIQDNASHILVMADNGDNRLEFTDRLTLATQGQCPIVSVTPLGFFETQVMLFWSLLVQRLDLKAQFPIRLRPETEQELATRLWRTQLDAGLLQQPGVTEPRLVRRMLDWLQLAALAGIPLEEVAILLEQGFPSGAETAPLPWTAVGNALLAWRDWCLEQGLLTYGILAELYWRHLLPDETYRRYLKTTYWAVLADDVDNYPAIVQQLLTTMLDQGAIGAFTYNPDGAVRLGIGADPAALSQLASRCRVDTLLDHPTPSLITSVATDVLALVSDPFSLRQLPEPTVQTIQTVARAQLLRRVAETIAQAIQQKQIAPQEVAVLAPGLDAIARYTLSDLLAAQGIPSRVLNEQRPLINSAIVRALLTLLSLIYPGMGRLIHREAVAEMLVVLSSSPVQRAGISFYTGNPPENPLGMPGVNPASVDPATTLSVNPPSSLESSPAAIDPVRAGLLVDYCFEPHPDLPQLLPIRAFPRWDRLGYTATTAYEAILQWLEVQKQQQAQHLLPSAIVLLDRAIQQFLWGGSHLPYDQVAALRELMETAQHYWEVDIRLRQRQLDNSPQESTVAQFIQLLRNGAITANPFPVRSPVREESAITLANVFQYRSLRCYHRWQFWLDIGDQDWLSGTDSLYGYALFLQSWSGHAWTEQDQHIADEQRLHRILLDLLGRTSDQLILCHSDLDTNGQEQMGPLLALITPN
jgi:hypothetical protein